MYGFVITTAGEAMLARAAAGETLVLDGASVGKGVVLSTAAAKALTALIDPVAEATTSSPAVAGQQISITVEYRNDMNGGLETGFALSEFGITAHVGDDPSGLLYYGSLGDAPQTVKPIDQGLDAHRFPVAIAVTGEVSVTLDYPAGGFVTWDELGDLDYDPAGSAAAVKEDLEEKLNGKVSIDGIIFDTLNNATTPGRFTVQVPWDSEGLPFPTTADGGFVWGILDVYEQALSGRFILQIFSPITTTNDLYYRKNINSSGWTKWEKIATFPSDLGTAGARAISAGPTELGSSALATGQIHLVYG